MPASWPSSRGLNSLKHALAATDRQGRDGLPEPCPPEIRPLAGHGHHVEPDRRFPGSRRQDYEEMAALLPHIVHLQPPDGPGLLRSIVSARISIIRRNTASATFDRNPSTTTCSRQKQTSTRSPTTSTATTTVGPSNVPTCWQASKPTRNHGGSVDGEKPETHSLGRPFGWRRVRLVDTRRPDGPPQFQLIDRQHAEIVMSGARENDAATLAWAMERHWLAAVDGRLVPLATASPAGPMNLESSGARRSQTLPAPCL